MDASVNKEASFKHC